MLTAGFYSRRNVSFARLPTVLRVYRSFGLSAASWFGVAFVARRTGFGMWSLGLGLLARTLSFVRCGGVGLVTGIRSAFGLALSG